jgi:hypothetical protein
VTLALLVGIQTHVLHGIHPAQVDFSLPLATSALRLPHGLHNATNAGPPSRGPRHASAGLGCRAGFAPLSTMSGHGRRRESEVPMRGSLRCLPAGPAQAHAQGGASVSRFFEYTA